jgi:hypothetical protein
MSFLQIFLITFIVVFILVMMIAYISRKNEEVKKLEPVILQKTNIIDSCLSFRTGHPLVFENLNGFKSVKRINDLREIKDINIIPKISTIYKNKTDDLNKILISLKENKKTYVNINDEYHMVEICTKENSISFVYFSLGTAKYIVSVKDNKLILVPRNLEEIEVIFKLNNVKRDDTTVFGVLECYDKFYEKGWIDDNMEWNAGESISNSKLFKIINNKILSFDDSNNSISTEDGSFSILLSNINLVFIENIPFYMNLRLKKLNDLNNLNNLNQI